MPLIGSSDSPGHLVRNWSWRKFLPVWETVLIHSCATPILELCLGVASDKAAGSPWMSSEDPSGLPGFLWYTFWNWFRRFNCARRLLISRCPPVQLCQIARQLLIVVLAWDLVIDLTWSLLLITSHDRSQSSRVFHWKPRPTTSTPSTEFA